MLRLATKFLPERSAFQQAHDAGFRHAEFFLNRDLLERVDDILALARQFDMRYALHFPNKADLQEVHLQECVRLFHEVNASAIVIHPPLLKKYADQLRAIDSGVVLAIETMRVPADELLAWVEQHQAVTLDMEHIWMFTLPEASLDEFLKLVRSVFQHHAHCVKHVHMPGQLPGHGEHRPMYTSREFCLGVFDILADFSFDGLVVSEVDMPYQNPFYLRMDALLYEGWLHKRTAEQQA